MKHLPIILGAVVLTWYLACVRPFQVEPVEIILPPEPVQVELAYAGEVDTPASRLRWAMFAGGAVGVLGILGYAIWAHPPFWPFRERGPPKSNH